MSYHSPSSEQLERIIQLLLRRYDAALIISELNQLFIKNVVYVSFY